MRTILTATILALTLTGCTPASGDGSTDDEGECGVCDEGACYYIPAREDYYCMTPCDEKVCVENNRCHEFKSGMGELRTCAVVEYIYG